MKMTPEYMAELHKFLHDDNETDPEVLSQKVREHLRYIPRKKLYRYRPCTEREFQTLQSNSIWLANPQGFLDPFDAKISMPKPWLLGFDYSMFLNQEIAYKVWVETAEEGEIIPPKDEFEEKLYAEMIEVIGKYTDKELDRKMIEIFGEDEYQHICRKINSMDMQVFSRRAEQVKKSFQYLSDFPRDNIAITSFTTNHDNRNMWENYAQQYSGFCIEYDFSRMMKRFTLEEAVNVLHLLPVSYYKKLPVFDYENTLRRMVQADVKIHEFDLDLDDFLPQYYQAITAKQYDYRSEQEWRLVLNLSSRGLHHFPYISKIYAGKDISDDDWSILQAISSKLNVPLLKQCISSEDSAFDYLVI